MPATETLKRTAPAPEMMKRSHASRHPCGATAVMGLHSASLCPRTTFQALVPRLPHQLRRKRTSHCSPQVELTTGTVGGGEDKEQQPPRSSVPGGTRGAFKKTSIQLHPVPIQPECLGAENEARMEAWCQGLVPRLRRRGAVCVVFVVPELGGAPESPASLLRPGFCPQTFWFNWGPEIMT